MKHTLVALPALLLMAALPLSKTAHMDGKKTEWVSLFDGKTTHGWHSYGKSTADAQWDVQDGALHLDKSRSGRGDLLTDKTYSNFDLKLEWKISPKGNSGILIYVQEDTKKYQEPYHTGPEMQVLDNDGHPDGKIHKHRAGDLYDLIPCTKETVKPVGEWNEVEIISNNGELKLFLNGTNVVTTTLWNGDWKTLVSASKFREWPDFGTFKSGKIDLQDHGNEVWYRNIKIKEL
jgi:hypothetical protein